MEVPRPPAALVRNGRRNAAAYGLFGHYEDELARIDGQWLFTRRAIYNESIRARAQAGQQNPAE